MCNRIAYRYPPPYTKYICIGALLILAIPIIIIIPVALLMLIEGDTYA